MVSLLDKFILYYQLLATKFADASFSRTLLLPRQAEASKGALFPASLLPATLKTSAITTENALLSESLFSFTVVEFSTNCKSYNHYSETCI